VAFVVIVISAWQARGREFVGTRAGDGRSGGPAAGTCSTGSATRDVSPVAACRVARRALLVAEGLARIAFRTVRSSGDATDVLRRTQRTDPSEQPRVSRRRRRRQRAALPHRHHRRLDYLGRGVARVRTATRASCSVFSAAASRS
jgi:hypothetical protein